MGILKEFGRSLAAVVVVYACAAGSDLIGSSPSGAPDAGTRTNSRSRAVEHFAATDSGTNESGVGDSFEETPQKWNAPSASDAAVDSGGGSVIPTAHAAEDGSRLKAIWHVTPGGARQFSYRWRDTELGTICQFVQAADGKQRCLPRISFGAVPLSDEFADANCETRLYAGLREDCRLPRWGYTSSRLDACSGSVGYAIFELSSKLFQPSVVYRRASDGTCEETPTEDTYLVVTREVPPEEMVEGRVEVGE